jgi:hypothetical protein
MQYRPGVISPPGPHAACGQPGHRVHESATGSISTPTYPGRKKWEQVQFPAEGIVGFLASVENGAKDTAAMKVVCSLRMAIRPERLNRW